MYTLIIFNKILKMDSKSQKSDSENNQNNHRKKSTRKKKPVEQFTQQTRTNRRTRQKATSQQQYALPQHIPISQTPELSTFQSFDRQTTKIIIQFPLVLLKDNYPEREAWTRVQESIVDLKIKAEEDIIAIDAKIRVVEEDLHDQESEEQDIVFNVWGKAFWVGDYEVNSKICKQAFKTISNSYSEIMRLKTKSVNSDIFIIINLRRKISPVTDYNGLINQGNTCYMNSYLQMLFHISQFQYFFINVETQYLKPTVRNRIDFLQLFKFSFTIWLMSKKQFLLNSLQNPLAGLKKRLLFSKMPNNLVAYFLKFYKESQMSSAMTLNVLICVRCFQANYYTSLPVLMLVLYSIYADFRSEHQEPFFDLQLTLTDSLEHSLDDYVAQQLLIQDNMYDTQHFGKQPAKKSVRILTLPPILMIQLKRFEFSPITYKNEKIMTKFRYPNEIDFSKWLVHTEQKNQYQLYAVLVHEGTKAQSGHYYVYIKDQNSWYKFNDQEVTLASPRQVFEYNFGGENQVVDLDSREMKVLNRSFTCSSTAYMLVYVQKNMSKHLLNNKIEYPSWLKARQITKQEQKQQIKARKNYYHNIKTLTWQDEFYNNDASYIGLIERSQENRNISSESCLEKIPKNQKIEEWLQQYNKNDIGVYLYITNADKAQYETVVNLQHRKSTFQELLRDQASPIFLFLPKIIPIHSYLYIIKLVTLKDEHFMLTESQTQKIKFDPEIQIKFHDIMQVGRQQKNFQLVSRLQDKFNEEGYSYRFFYEQKKELKSIYKDNNLVLGSATPRNILEIIIVEKIPEEIIKMNFKFNPTEKWYLSQRNTVEILVRSEGGKYQFMVYVDKNMDIDSLRELIFEEKLRGDETFASPANIVLKSKPKKTSKIFVQQTGALKVKDLLKGCDKQKVIVFEPSSLNAEERLNQTEIKFYYRFQDFSYSQCFRIVIDKESKSEETNIFTKIREHEQVRINLKKEKMQGLRLLLLSKDRQTINDVVSVNGSVPGKGELVSVLEKQKNANLIAEGYPIREISEDVCPIIINHKSQNGDKIGKPRYWEVKKDMSLIQLRQTVTQLIKDESYEWQEKLYPVNPFKLYIYAYWKDIRKKVELFDEQEIQELEANNMEPTVIDLEENGSQDSKKIEDQNENEQKSNKNENEEDVNNQYNKQKNEEPNETKTRKQESKKTQKKINYCSYTIENKFPKAKFLKVFIFHLYLVRNNQMKLNV